MSEKEHFQGLPLKKEIGKRFKRFRAEIKKTQADLAEELGVYQSTITNIEVGKTFPGIKYLHYFQDKYRLNANWLLSNMGEMFVADEENSAKPAASVLGCHVQEEDPRFNRYLELVDLMQVPVIEQIILAKLTELKVFAKEEIDEFRSNEPQQLSG